MKKPQPPPTPPPFPTGAAIRLHKDQFDLLASRMATQAVTRHHLALVTDVAARHQQAQADAVAAQSAVEELLRRLGVDPAINYQLDVATRTLTPAQVAVPPAGRKDRRGPKP